MPKYLIPSIQNQFHCLLPQKEKKSLIPSDQYQFDIFCPSSAHPRDQNQYNVPPQNSPTVNKSHFYSPLAGSSSWPRSGLLATLHCFTRSEGAVTGFLPCCREPSQACHSYCCTEHPEPSHLPGSSNSYQDSVEK